MLSNFVQKVKDQTANLSSTQKKALLATAAAPVAVHALSRVTRFLLSSPQAGIAPNTTLENKTVIITGCSAGIGLAVAKACYQLGAHVIMANRDKAKTEKAILNIIAHTTKSTPGRLDFIPIDLSNLPSVVQFVNKFHERNLDLHFLINNAGAAHDRKGVKLESGVELESLFVTNYLGHFLLVELLMEDLKKTQGRVIATASGAQEFVNAAMFEGLSLKSIVEQEEYKKVQQRCPKMQGGMACYGLSKAFNTMHMKDLANRHTKSTRVTFYSMCPGPVETELSRDAPFLLRMLMNSFFYFVGRNPDNGAQTILHLMLNDKVTSEQSGEFYRNNVIQKTSTVVTPARIDELRSLSLEYVQKYLSSPSQ